MATETTETIECAHWRLAESDTCESCGRTPEEIRNQERLEDQAAYITGLRELADWLEQHPEVAFATPYGETVNLAVQTKAELATVASALGRCQKYSDHNWFGVRRHFGSIQLDCYALRENVCTRIVKGTREVTKEVPDPDAPMVTVTETVEDVEWVCEPLLAGETS